MDIPVIKTSGTPQERGHTYGQQAAKQINESAKFYADLFNLTLQELETQGNNYKKQIAAINPSYNQEIAAIARASNQPEGIIYAINARTEIRSYAHECTSLADPQNNLYAQTWDWAAHQENQLIILHHTNPDGHEFISVTEAGMLAKIGLSSTGLSVCLNALPANGTLPGTPIHILLRAALDAKTLMQAQELLAQHHQTAGNILLGTTNNTYYNFEQAINDVHTYQGTTRFAHTNHYLNNPPTKPTSTQDRYNQATKLLRNKNNTAQEILANEQGTNPIKRAYKHKEKFGLHGTVCTVLLEPATGRMRVEKTNQQPGVYQEITLDKQ